LVLTRRYAIMHEITMPKVAAITAVSRLFLEELRMDFRVKILAQYRRVMFPGAKTDSPRFTVMLDSATVIKGMITMTSANNMTTEVMRILHFPKSTILGLVDFPETVMYCFFPKVKVER